MYMYKLHHANFASEIGTRGAHITSVFGMGAKITDGDSIMLILLVKLGRGCPYY